jgi:glycosyltransferase involved in cell wall biosynthesis
MRIALVTSYMPPHLGGIETIGQHLYEGYLARGHEVRWLTSRVPASLPPREGGIVRVRCGNWSEDWLGIPVPVWGLEAARELRALVAWSEAVHVLECLYLSSAMAVAAARRGRKPVLLSQNVGFIPYRSALVRGVEHVAYQTLGRAVLGGSSHVALATPTAESWVRGMYRELRPGWASVIPVGIDTRDMRPSTPSERAAAREALGLAPDRPVALFAGRLVEKKGVPLVLETAAQVPGTDFLLAGDGPLRGLLASASPNVRPLGSVDGRTMRRLYAAADVVFLPSCGEGLPLVVQEAMSCGLPVVISADEIYARGLVEARACEAAERRAPDMAAALARALRDREALGRTARAYAEAHWDREAMIRRYEEILERLLGRV